MKIAEQILNKWCGEPLKENVAFIEQEYALKAMEEYASQFKPKKLTADDIEEMYRNFEDDNTLSTSKMADFLNEKIAQKRHKNEQPN